MLKTPYADQQMLDLLAKAHALPADLQFVTTPTSTNKVTTQAEEYHRNLLDNPMFKIDQRQGQIAPPNTNYYSDTSLTTLVGQTTEYVTVTAKASGYNTINIGGTDYYVAVADCVRGYVNLSGLVGFDRWNNNTPSTITLLIQDGIKLDFTQSYGQIRQAIPKADLVGETLTASVVFDSTLLTASGIVSTSYVQSEIVDSSYIRFIYNTLTDNVDIEVVTTKTGGVIVKAVKLEKSSISTLQAEMDSGAYDEDLDLWECRERLQVFDFPINSTLGATLGATSWVNTQLGAYRNMSSRYPTTIIQGSLWCSDGWVDLPTPTQCELDGTNAIIGSAYSGSLLNGYTSAKTAVRVILSDEL